MESDGTEMKEIREKVEFLENKLSAMDDEFFQRELHFIQV